MAKFGFAGVGLMGQGMARNLMKAGHELTLSVHRNRKPVEELLAAGAREAASLAELPTGQDAIFICVATSEQVASVIGQMEPALTAGQIVIDTGTSDPGSTLRLAERLAARGVRLVDAPMGGGAQQAAAGALASMVGGSPEDYAQVEPWIRCYSKVSAHMGSVGAGHRAKLLNNLLALGQAALVVEAYAIARDQGIDWAKLYEVNMGGAARSGALERIIPPAVAGDLRGYMFTVENAVKDLSYYVASAEASGHAAELGTAIRSVFSQQVHRGRGQDFLSELLRSG